VLASIAAFFAAAQTWIKVILAALGLADKVADEIHDERQRDAGRAEATREQAQEGARVEHDIADAAAQDVTEDEAIAAMEKGEG
jgi:hypothetical protein